MNRDEWIDRFLDLSETEHGLEWDYLRTGLRGDPEGEWVVFAIATGRGSCISLTFPWAEVDVEVAARDAAEDVRESLPRNP